MEPESIQSCCGGAIGASLENGVSHSIPGLWMKLEVILDSIILVVGSTTLEIRA